MEDSIPFVSMADFEQEEVKEIESASGLLKLAILSCKESDIRHSYIAKHMLALETKKMKKNPLPFNLNLKPRTYRRPRSTPIDIRTLLPYHHQIRNSENSQHSQELIYSSSSSGSSSQSSKKLRFTIRVKPSAQPELPFDFKDKIAELGGSDPELVFIKTLYPCDVDSSKSRLTLPYKQCRVDLGDARNKPVKVIYRPGDEVKEMMMNLNKWDTVSSYVFNGSWNDLVHDNDLKVKDVVQVWCFRLEGEMSFALVKL